jgi:hypothetical protein
MINGNCDIMRCHVCRSASRLRDQASSRAQSGPVATIEPGAIVVMDIDPRG